MQRLNVQCVSWIEIDNPSARPIRASFAELPAYEASTAFAKGPADAFASCSETVAVEIRGHAAARGHRGDLEGVQPRAY